MALDISRARQVQRAKVGFPDSPRPDYEPEECVDVDSRRECEGRWRYYEMTPSQRMAALSVMLDNSSGRGGVGVTRFAKGWLDALDSARLQSGYYDGR